MRTKHPIKANFGERLYPWSDWAKEDFESQKLGAFVPASRSMGLVMPPESERNAPENQEKLDALYANMEMNRAYTPRTYSSQSLGNKFFPLKSSSLYALYLFVIFFLVVGYGLVLQYFWKKIYRHLRSLAHFLFASAFVKLFQANKLEINFKTELD